MLIAAFSALLIQSSAADLAAPPPRYREGALEPRCVCTDEPPTGLITLEGLVVDAEVTLAPGGLSTNDRQATIFDVAQSSKGDIKGRTRVWHSTVAAQCGVTFNYGQRYTITTRRLEEDGLETDACLAPSRYPRTPVYHIPADELDQ